VLKGERQVEPTIKTIAPDHKYRYQWVAGKMDKEDVVLDACCGVGYGSYIMAKAGCRSICGFDISQEAIEYARSYYLASNIDYLVSDCSMIRFPCNWFTKIVCFEAIEHIDKSEYLLSKFNQWLKEDGILYISSPNETINPYSKEKYPFHTSHWTPKEFEQMLNEAGFNVKQWYSQRDKVSKRMDNHPFGRTMIAECIKL